MYARKQHSVNSILLTAVDRVTSALSDFVIIFSAVILIRIFKVCSRINTWIFAQLNFEMYQKLLKDLVNLEYVLEMMRIFRLSSVSV